MFNFKSLLGLIISMTIVSSSIAANKMEITYSADKIQSALNNQGSLLKGNAQLQVGKVKIVADKMLIKYANNKDHQINECIIYGKGTLNDGTHAMQFEDGIFDPNTLKISAKQIKQIK